MLKQEKILKRKARIKEISSTEKNVKIVMKENEVIEVIRPGSANKRYKSETSKYKDMYK